ncbi:ATP-binding protein [Corallococcus aberystwythensis]|uniref:ATP-binding protein n=1 Tax=Corallococcus aberystwythensis TaxID=2316722 RepID=UPI0013156C15|nr:ATP-binding protein [Corallococcus aberystwythensis]
MNNPYNWKTHSPSIIVPRVNATNELVVRLARGEGCVLLGATGAGKSVLVRSIHKELNSHPDKKSYLITAPPTSRTTRSFITKIQKLLELEESDCDLVDTLSEHINKNKETYSSTIIIDGFERFLGSGKDEDLYFATGILDTLESAAREFTPKLSILVSGGLNFFLLRSTLGSPFLSRAAFVELPPLSENEINALSLPLVQSRPIEAGSTDALLLLSGGNSSLAVYGLQNLWEKESISVKDVELEYLRFRDRHADFFQAFTRPLNTGHTSSGAIRVWRSLLKYAPTIERTKLTDELAFESNNQTPDLNETLRLLKAAGLIRVSGSLYSNPLSVTPVSSIITLTAIEQSIAPDIRTQALRDTLKIIQHIHSISSDFYRGSETAKNRQLVPEAVFSAVIVVALRQMGWTAEREALGGAGRTDIKATHQRFAGDCVIEVKIWPRNDYKQIHDQAVGYQTSTTRASLVLMIGDTLDDQWADTYKSKCLEDRVSQNGELSSLGISHFVVESRDALPVDHLLLQMAKRK